MNSCACVKVAASVSTRPTLTRYRTKRWCMTGCLLRIRTVATRQPPCQAGSRWLTDLLFRADQVVVGLAAANQPMPRAVHHDLGGAAAAVVIGTHRHAV